MTHEVIPAGGSAGDSRDYGEYYYNDAHLGGDGDYSWESDAWRGFFQGVARRIASVLAPRRTLDVGCAKGLLVQALLEQGVDAWGSDISDFAVSSAHPEVRERLSVASATDPIEGRYDLISCIEVLEHMTPEDAQKAIDVMCAATDRILFSSTPADFAESTHINVNPSARWVTWFAERGFFRRTDIDAGFVAPWTVLFERGEVTPAVLAGRYETLLSPLQIEVADKRQALLEADRQRSDLMARVHALETTLGTRAELARKVSLDDAQLLEAHAKLVSRDAVIGLEASIASLQEELALSELRQSRMKRRIARQRELIEALRGSRTWKIGRAVTGPLGKLRGAP